MRYFDKNNTFFKITQYLTKGIDKRYFLVVQVVLVGKKCMKGKDPKMTHDMTQDIYKITFSHQKLIITKLQNSLIFFEKQDWMALILVLILFQMINFHFLIC